LHEILCYVRARIGLRFGGARVNSLYYGDNLDILREHIASESVDLQLANWNLATGYLFRQSRPVDSISARRSLNYVGRSIRGNSAEITSGARVAPAAEESLACGLQATPAVFSRFRAHSESSPAGCGKLRSISICEHHSSRRDVLRLALPCCKIACDPPRRPP
jgi:hypothetical protein